VVNDKPNNKVLMVAFHFPPQAGSSGIQRTLRFAQYLPASHWRPLVLSAHPRAYAGLSSDQMADADALHVTRAFALDSARHLSLRGRYLGWTALPDRWVSWCLGAVPAGLRLIRRERPQVIWSTYPIASAHLIGAVLQRLSGLPWVADLRDPMIDDSHPHGRLPRLAAAWVERLAVRRAARVVCTTPGAVRSYRQRYPELPPERFCLIENGYDEHDFSIAESQSAQQPPAAARATDGPFVLLHSGIVYPSERDPRPLLAALAMLKRDGKADGRSLRLVLRAPVHVELLQALVREHAVDDMVEIAPALPYRAALAEMLAADGLLILQAANCNAQVPAKLYEYLRAARPLLALTDAAGDTAATLRAAGIDTIAPLDDAAAIAAALLRFLGLARAGQAPLAPEAVRRAQARSSRAAQLALLFDQVAAEARAPLPAPTAAAE
jgi:glycosyltransferase involved in cell wall biosynthesis